MKRKKNPMKAAPALYFLMISMVLWGCKEPTANVELGTISGTIVDSETNAPLAGALVLTSPPTSDVHTDSTGKFAIANVNIGTYMLVASRSRYKSRSENLTVTANTVTVAAFALSRAVSGMVFVAGGTFQMGSGDSFMSERPVHAVTVRSFYIDPTEVTVAQYRAFCTATRRKFPNPPAWGWVDDNPIMFVGWEDAREYAKWAGKRLPTEAEWEYAASGGNLSHGYSYSGSNTRELVAWCSSNSEGRTHSVGTKLPNELGLYDMTGNVWEWVSDWYDDTYYSVSPSLNPTGPAEGTKRVVRGGAWYNLFVSDCSVHFRYGLEPSYDWGNGVGFRCAQDW